MAAGPKGVPQSHNSLPAQQAAADPLQLYCPDLEQWPRSWLSYEAGAHSARRANSALLRAVPAPLC